MCTYRPLLPRPPPAAEEEQVEVAQQFMDAKARAPLTPQTEA